MRRVPIDRSEDFFERFLQDTIDLINRVDNATAEVGMFIKENMPRLAWDQGDVFLGRLRAATGKDWVEAAIMVAKDKLDRRFCGIGLPVRLLLLLAEDKDTQSRLLSGTFKLRLSDGTDIEKTFFNMTTVEKVRLLGNDAKIHEPRQQTIKKKAAPTHDTAKLCSYDRVEDTVTMKGSGNYTSATFQEFRDQLEQRGELEAFLDRFQTVVK